MTEQYGLEPTDLTETCHHYPDMVDQIGRLQEAVIKLRGPEPSMTLKQRINFGTTDYLELTSGYLGATPDMPGGCQTNARFQLSGSKLISTELLDWLVRQADGPTEHQKDRIKLMQEFRDSMEVADPEGVVKDGVRHPAFKRDPKQFKFAQSEYLFKIWMAGREPFFKLLKAEGEQIAQVSVADIPVGGL